jgi:hypothetical protein
MNKPNYLATLVQGANVLDSVAASYGVSPRTLRVLGALEIGHATTYKVGSTAVSKLLGCSYDTTLAGINQAISKGWLVYSDRISWALRLTDAGRLVLAALVRAERKARRAVDKHDFPKWPRKYTRQKDKKQADIL